MAKMDICLDIEARVCGTYLKGSAGDVVFGRLSQYNKQLRDAGSSKPSSPSGQSGVSL
jgi:hypothetical protein